MTPVRGYPWLKLWATYSEDPRYLRLSDAGRAMYFSLYILAGKADAGGFIRIGEDPATSNDLAFMLHREVNQVEDAIRELAASSLLTLEDNEWRITRFMDEQGPSMSDQREKWKERQARRRAKLIPQDQNPEEDSEEEEYKEVEVEEEVTHESRVTNYTTAHPSDAQLEDIWKKVTGLPVDKELRDRIISTLRAWGDVDSYYGWTAEFRLEIVVRIWKFECKQSQKDGQKWSERNPDAILERFPIPDLERTMQEKGIIFSFEDIERIRQDVLRYFENAEMA